MSESRLLVVDDDFSNLELMKTFLSLNGYGVEIAASYEEAMEKAATVRFDGFLLDIHMPQVDGVTLCEELKRLYPTAPVIYHSGAHPATIANTLARCGNTYIAKPLDLNLVLRTLLQQIVQHLEIEPSPQ